MKNDKVLLGFILTLVVAILLRYFVFDVISVSNDILQPEFYPGDFVLVSKLTRPMEGDWALLKDHPGKSIYSLRKIVRREADQGWAVLEPKSEQKPYVDDKNVKGKAILILWSLPCKPAAVVNGSCPEKGPRFFKAIH